MENEKKKASVQVTEGTASANAEKRTLNKERLKKPVIFGIMGIICAACLYFIFGRDLGSTAKEEIKAGINDAVPQASDDALPTDKGKAYEQEMLRQRNQEKKEAMMSLSDYWQSDTTVTAPNVIDREKETSGKVSPTRPVNAALNSYRTMQTSLANFHRPDDGQQLLRKENEELKKKLEEKVQSQGRSTDDRLALMEKSYQMAAKYFPGNVAADTDAPPKDKPEGDADFVIVHPQPKSVVSSLHREVPDSVFIARLANGESNTFHTATSVAGSTIPSNSIRACIHQSVKITAEGTVQLRLLQDTRIGQAQLPSGFIMSAAVKFQSNRLQLQVTSVEVDGSIIPVNLTVYDLDGQQGLNLPYSPEVSAVNGTIANMGNTTGSSFTINRSAGQQVVADASRGLIQGVSGYFSKKVRAQKANLKAGYQLFLVSKKK
jgi:conjugative transposon TraM protein